MSLTELSQDEKTLLLDIANRSICYGLENNQPLKPDLKAYPPVLQQNRATFVTLHLNHQLRGCIGTLTAYQPLVTDVAEHAYAAAFKDPRFPPVSQQEIKLLDIHISILTPAETINFSSEKDLISKIRPGIDGLILESGYNKGTFLPSVWESLTDPEDFLAHLKLKAGLTKDYWNNNIKVSRYQTISIP